MNITKTTIGRLFNLGSYEHVRYELTVEIPQGESPATAIVGMERILAGLAPIKNIKSTSELLRDAAEIEQMKTMPVADWQRRYGHCEGSAKEVIDRYQKALDEATRQREEAVERAAKARKLFDDLGGAAQWKDAKLDWDNDDQF